MHLAKTLKGRSSRTSQYDFTKGRNTNERGKLFTLVELYPTLQVAWYYFQDLFLGFVRAGNTLGLLEVATMSNGLKENI